MHPLQLILQGNSEAQRGVYSVCTSNELVLQAAIRHAKKFNYVLVIEATANQVNQFGGYTGMQPTDFVKLVESIAILEGLPKNQLILGGDHLGPLTWQHLNEEQAMTYSEELVRAYTLAGFTKIHLDTSMRVASDDPNSPLEVKVCANRCVRLAKCVYQAYEQRLSEQPDSLRPVLVIGSEVPIPGGSQAHEDFITPTEPLEFERQYNLFKEAFNAANLNFDDVIAFVVQPGVEFGDDFVFQYNRENAKLLVEKLQQYKPMVFEGHSTDYQTASSLAAMVEDDIRILKVGPGLTFGLREALFLAEDIEKSLIADSESQSRIRDNLLREMNSSDKYWRRYYTGSESEIEYKKLYSYSDRCRYYLPQRSIQESIDILLKNLTLIPVALISQYFPRQYTRVMKGQLEATGLSILLDRICDWCDPYASACGIKIDCQE